MNAADDTQRCASCGRTSAFGYEVCPWCGASLPPAAPKRIVVGAHLDFGWAVAVLGPILGEGGMGVVHHATMHPRSGEPPIEAAVKILHATFAQQGRVKELFLNEAKILAMLAHPCVVRFLGLADVAGTSAIAMEYVKGETLGSLIERKAAQAAQQRAQRPGIRTLPCLPFDRAWHYFQQMLGALAATHALAVVHRDVKPDNLLIRFDGVAKLTDFGIARIPQSVAHQTGNMIAGTVAYMSPEQIQGKPLDGRSDLYSAGVVLFEALTGQLPFPVEDRSDWLIACDHVQTPPPPLRRFLPQAPVELEMLVAKALAKEPGERFQTAVEFGEAFRSLLGIRDDAGWRAQQAMAQQAEKVGTAIRLGQAIRSDAGLAAARADVAAAYGK